MALTDTKIRKAKPREKVYRMADAGGLCLEVRPSGSKIWRYRYRLFNTPNMFTVGEYPVVTLAEARQTLMWARGVVSEGRHPKEQRTADMQAQRRDRELLFRHVAEEWFEKGARHWSGDYHTKIRRLLDNEVLPQFGDEPLKSLSVDRIHEVVSAIDNRGSPTTAIRVRQTTGSIFDHAIIGRLVDVNPTLPLKRSVKRPRVKNARALEAYELFFLLDELSRSRSYRSTVIAMELLIYTMMRGVELRRGVWSEIDFEDRLWRIPAKKMKMRRPHLIPLSDQALELLREQREYSGHGSVIFPNAKDPSRPINNTTINAALYRMGFKGSGFATHGFRSTASTFLNEAGWSGDAVEMQLAHEDDDEVRATYNQAKYLDTRREMLVWWAEFVDSLRPAP
ncbi:tyrosine-type recombinase/integrase [Salinicola socius]|uniref:Tyr recombinase domain-containing protein n=1 Tax=Salinicola socius TaxID=404433 RepID=A0A1Q8SPE1_9GAMM|nr:tyrosine-type recombinase/integrase [Salinicola socius]OLO03300.1 hypothetical protein BTW07_14545 [Salinicola socius]